MKSVIWGTTGRPREHLLLWDTSYIYKVSYGAGCSWENKAPEKVWHKAQFRKGERKL